MSISTCPPLTVTCAFLSPRWGLTSPDLAVTHNDGPTSPSFPVDILPRGVVVSKREGYGSLGGIGQGLIMHYTANFSEAFMSVYAHHFRSTALSQEDVDAMRNIAQVQLTPCRLAQTGFFTLRFPPVW